ncbi:MAG: DUF1566 domain-containing protein, partial [Desulfobacterales bacterium]
DRQSLFFKKSANGLFYGTLEPLAEPYGAVAIHLGFARKKTAAAAAQETGLEMENIGLPAKSMEERIVEEVDEESGMVNGVGLATFLLEAEIEKSSCSLRVSSGHRQGYLFLKDGVLIDAMAGKTQGMKAAVEVISWIYAEIAFENPVERETDDIGEPLIKILAAALKKRKQQKQKVQGADSGQPEADTAEAPLLDPQKLKGSARTVPAASGKKSKKKKARKKKSRIRPLHIAAAVAVLILASGAFWGFNTWKDSQREKALVAVTAEADAESDADRAVALLQAFVDAGPEDEYTRQARERIETVQREAEKGLVDRLEAEVAALPLGPDFETRAEQLYRRYLKQYPQGRYAGKIESRIASIPSLVEARYYLQVTQSEAQAPDVKMEAYRAYLQKLPEGVHRSEVESRLESLVAARLRDLELEVRRCEMAGDPRPCLALCDAFLAKFSTPSSAQTVSRWRRELMVGKDMEDLEARTAGLEQKPEQLRQALQAFIQERSDSPVAEEAKQRLAVVEQQLADKRRWEQVEAAARDGGRPLAGRIEAVSAYLAQEKNEAYRRSALSLKSDLERAYALEEQQRRAAQADRIRQAQRAQQQARLEQERRRLAGLSQQIEQQLSAGDGRFVSRADGTFVDSRTGLIWTLLDSQRVLERCQDYQAARRYVEGLATGGFGDWRFPTAAELAGLYKNRPFFPDGDVSWYWTSQFFVTGYHEKVRVVTPDGKSELQPEYRRSTECGAVRAVRDPR